MTSSSQLARLLQVQTPRDSPFYLLKERIPNNSSESCQQRHLFGRCQLVTDKTNTFTLVNLFTQNSCDISKKVVPGREPPSAVHVG